MRTSHYITIIVAAALIAALYFFANTTPPVKEAEKPTANAGSAMPAVADNFSIQPYIDSVRATLPGHAMEELATLEEKAAQGSDIEKADIYNGIAQLWLQHRNMPVAAYYFTEKANLENSEKSLNFAGRFNLDLMQMAGSPGVRGWAAQNAISCFEQSLELNPNSDTVKMALASCYIDGTSQPMQGIQLLLGIVREQPDNIPANLMLGQLSIRSGQMDKAKERFEKVLSLEPENTEALYFLAEVYRSKGNKEKAIELLERCKKIINKPEFDKEIDNYIKSFK